MLAVLSLWNYWSVLNMVHRIWQAAGLSV
jgi:hypothetical protein